MKRLGELVLLLVVVSVVAWTRRSTDSPLQIMIAISPFADGSHGYYVKLNGTDVECCGIERKITPDELEKVARALETGRAWTAGDADYSHSNSGLLFSQFLLQQGGKTRQFSWKGIGPSEFRLAESLIVSPIGPELKEVIHSAASWLREGLPLPPKPPTRRIIGCRQEILLERAGAGRIVPLLEYAYPEVEFIMHPTMNGFYTVGSRSDILAIKNDVPNLDQLAFLSK